MWALVMMMMLSKTETVRLVLDLTTPEEWKAELT